MLLYLRSSQKLLTRVDRHRARQGPTTIDFRVFRLCRRTRAFIVAARFIVSKASLGTRWHTEPPPTFPFRKSQCQTARQTDVFTPLFNETPLAQQTLRKAAWARVIGAASPQVKRKNRGKNAFFQAVVDGLFGMSPKARLWRSGLYIWGLPGILTPFG
jgi:hypothetical protein